MYANGQDRPGTITGVVTKHKPDSKLGLSFKREKKRVVIHKVKGRFQQQTDFVPGLTILSINGTPIDSAAQAALLIRTAPAGNIHVVANGQIFKATKLRRNQKSGLGVKNIKEKRGDEPTGRILGVEITTVNENGMFPNMPTGHHLLAINGKRVTQVSDCVKWLKQKRKLTLIVVPPPPTAQPQQDGYVPPSAASSVAGDDESQFVDSVEGGSHASSYWSKSEKDPGSRAGVSQYSSSNWGGTSTIASGRDWNDEQSEFIDDYDDILLGSIDSLKELAKEMGQASAHHPTRIVTSMVVGESSGDLTSQQVGITLEERLQYIFIKEVDPKGPFGQTKLMKGQCLLRINGHSVQGGISLQQAQDWLVQPCKGDDSTPNNYKHSTTNRRVLIETMQGWGTPSQEPQHILVQVQKPPAFKDAPQNVALGMSLQKHSTGICITGIAPHGLLGAKEFSSCLQVGQTVLMANGLPCPKSTPELIKHLRDVYPIVSVECQDVDVDGVGITSPVTSNPDKMVQHVQTQVFPPVLGKERLTIEIKKPDNEATIGLSLRKSVQINSILVAGISAKGLAAGKGLVVGQKVLTINGRPCPSTTVETIRCLRKELYLKIEVADIDWSATLLQQQKTEKATAKRKKTIGIRLPNPLNPPEKSKAGPASTAIASDTATGTTEATSNGEAGVPTEIAIGGASSADNDPQELDGSIDPKATTTDILLKQQENQAEELAQLLGDFEAQLENVYKEAGDDDADSANME